MPTCDELANNVRAMRMLATAVLKEAVAVMRYSLPSQKAVHEAVQWMFGDTHDCAFPFLTVCEFLGLEPTAVRREVLRRCALPIWMLPHASSYCSTDMDPDFPPDRGAI